MSKQKKIPTNKADAEQALYDFFHVIYWNKNGIPKKVPGIIIIPYSCVRAKQILGWKHYSKIINLISQDKFIPNDE